MVSTGSSSSVRSPDAGAVRADVVVGITSYNDAATIGAVIGTVREGLRRSFGSSTACLVLADAGSVDSTRLAARQAADALPLVEVDLEGVAQVAVLPYHGRPGHAAALRAILREARRTDARACAVIEASVRSVQPEWVEGLLAPAVADGFDYVSPHYLRHPHEGALTKGIVYPTFRALYGARLRQPAASEFGCSARFADHCLEQDVWDAELASSGINLWLSIAAVAGSFRTCEVEFGPRASASHSAHADLSTTVAEVVGALFADLERQVDVWQRVRASAPVPVFGRVARPELRSQAMHHETLVESFRLGYRELREIWTWVLPARTIVELRRLSESPSDRIQFDDRMWARIVYDFAAGHAFRVMPRDHLLRSLTPLYNGWLASFLLEEADASPEAVDERLERLCLAFEAEKRHLIAKWRWPERLR